MAASNQSASRLASLWTQSRRSSKKQQRALVFIAVVFAGLFAVWRSLGAVPKDENHSRSARPVGQLPCRSLPGANDTLVVLKTGATELQDRLPIHFSTTFRCYPHYVIVSDHEEVFRGEKVLNILDAVSPAIRSEHPDFGLYRRLKQTGRRALDDTELSGAESEATSWGGKKGNQGWKVDKWKFLPMMNTTYYDYPDFKWYLFVEADTYIMWASLLDYLSVLDHTQPYYIGNQMVIGQDIFAHGGSGFVVSRPAMAKLADYYASYVDEMERFADWHWAGDCVLGVAFKRAGIPLTYAWPIFQEAHPGNVPYDQPNHPSVPDPTKRLWCYPSVSYHHVSPEMVEDIWKYEQNWMATHGKKDGARFLRHKDVYQQYVLPRATGDASDWDNESAEDRGLVSSAEACQTTCQASKNCLQWSLNATSHCKTSSYPGLGKFKGNMTSGWISDRMATFSNSKTRCGKEGWIIKN